MAEVLNHTGYFRYNGEVRKRPRRLSEIPLSERPSNSPSEALHVQPDSPVRTQLQEGVLVTIAPKATDVSERLSPDELASWMQLAQKDPTLLGRAADNGNLAAQRAIMELLAIGNQEPK